MKKNGLKNLAIISLFCFFIITALHSNVFGQCVLTSDMAMQTINAPSSGCNIGTQTVQITIRNNSTVTIASCPVKYSVDGVVTGTGTVSTSLLGCNGTTAFSFATQFNFVGRTAPYVLKCWTDLGGDSNRGNDTIMVNIQSDPVSIGGTTAGSTTVCSGSNSGSVTLSGHTGSITKWQQSIDGGGSFTDIANTTTTLNYTNITQTTIYRVVVQSGVCTATTSSTSTITVDPVSVGGSIASSATVCSGSNSGTLTLSGHTGAIQKWQQSIDAGASFTDIANTTTTQNYTNLTQTTIYRAVIKSGVCSAANSAAATITVDPVSVGGTVSGSTTVCSSSNTGSVTLSGHTGSITKWQQSIDGGSSFTDIANTTTTQNYTNLTQTTIYRAVIQSGVCSSVNSGTATIIVDPATVGGSISGSTTVCSGTNSGTLTLSGHTGSITKWQQSVDGGATFTDIANTTTTQNYTNNTQTTIYRAVVKSGVCTAANSSSATITVDPVSIGGSISGATNACFNSNSGNLTLSGHTGTIQKWQLSTDGGVSFSDIANTTTTQSYNNLTQTTIYRAVIKSGTCAATNSSSATITIDPTSVGGSISGSTSVCNGSNSGSLTLSGHTGSIQKWQLSTDGGATFNDIANTTTTQNYTNLTQTTVYRAVVKSGTCVSANSSTATITVDGVSVGGSIASSATVCSSGNSGTLTLSGHTGSVQKWQQSVDGGATFTDITNTSTTQNYTNLTQTTIYLAVVKNGVCNAVNSSTATITVDAASVGGSIAGSATVCASGNSGTLTLSGHTGSITKWQQSIDAGATFTDIANTTTTQGYNNLTQTTIYRAVVKNGSVCASANSSTATLTVDPTTVGGTVSSDATVCQGINAGSVTLSGNTGSVTKWQQSTDGGTTWTDIVNTTLSQNYNNISQTTMYRAVVKSGVCASANSSAAIITVDPTTVGGTVTGGTVVCNGSNSGILTLSGHTGNVVKWQFSTDGGATFTDIANTTTTQNYNNLTVATLYRAVVQSGSCASANSSNASMTIDAASVGGSVSGSTTACASGNSGTLTLTGNTGSVVKWQQSIDGGATFTDISNTGTTQNYNNLTQTTIFRAVVKNGSCSSANSSTAIITIDPLSVGGSVGPDASLCAPPNNGTLTLTGHTGSVVNWEQSTDGGSTWASIANTTTTHNYVNVPTTTLFRAIVKSGSCTSVASLAATITIGAADNAGTISGTSPVCSGSSGSVTLSGYVGSITSWEESPDGITWTTIANTTATQAYTNITQSTSYRVNVQGCSSTLITSVFTVSVVPQTNGGTLLGSTGYCGFTNSGTLTLSGHVGTIARWESSTDGGTTWSIISNTATTQNYTNLAQNTQYRVLVQNSVCASQYSSIATISVDPATVAGTLSASATVCVTANSGTLTLSGYTGSIIKWQQSIDNGVTFTDIVNTANTQNYTNLTQTTQYRVEVKSGTLCGPLTSNTITITVDPAVVAGTISAPAVAVCSGTSGTLTLSGHSGSVVRWESSIDGGVSFTTISNTTTTQNYTNISQTTTYKAILQNGSCGQAVTPQVTVTVLPITAPGFISSAATVCTTGNGGTLTLTGHAGVISKWQQSIDGGVTYTDIVNTTNAYTYSNLAQTTMYRVELLGCPDIFTSPVTITVDPAVVAGTISGTAAPVCQGVSGSLILSGHTGSVVRWESSTDGGTTFTSISNTTTTQNYTNINQTTTFRAVVQSGACGQATTPQVTLTVLPTTIAGFISSSASVCASGNGGTLTLAGYAGNIVRWQESIDGGITYTDIANTTNAQGYTNLTQTTMYRAELQGCTNIFTSPVTITVDAAVVAGTIAGAGPVCAGANGTLTLSGNVGTIVRWESSVDNGATFTSISNTSNVQNYNNIMQSIIYRAVVQSGICGQATTPQVVLSVQPTTIAGSISGGGTVCASGNSGTLTLSGHVGNIVRWQFSTDGGTSYTDIANTTTTQSYLNLGQTTLYRAEVLSCSSVFTNPVNITVDAASDAGTLTGQVFCGPANGTLTLIGTVGNVLRWEYSTDGTTFFPISNTNTSLPYNVTVTTMYRAIVQNGTVCGTSTSPIATIAVTNATVGGNVSGGANVCSGNNSGVLTLSGQVGNVQQWESSTDGGINFNIIPGETGITLAYTNVNQNTIYRALVSNCSPVYSGTASLTVDAVSVGGTVTSDATVCAGTPGTLTLSGHTGNVIRWESSTDGGVTYNTISNTSTTQAYNGSQSVMYRAIVQNGTCAQVASTPATITVNPVTISGSVLGATTVCATANNGLLTLTGNVGNVNKWQQSIDGGITYIDITNTGTVQSYTNIAQTTIYRAEVQSCIAAFTLPVTVTVDAASVGGTVNGGGAVCAGTSGILTLSGEVGSVLNWESSVDGGVTFNTISNTTTTQPYTASQDIMYRAVVQNGVCGAVTSTPAIIDVTPTTVGGSVIGSARVCSGSNSGVLTLTNSVGNIQQWEISTDGGLTFSPVASSGNINTFNYTNLTVTTQYRALLQSCTQAYSSIATIDVDAAPLGGVLNGSTVVCGSSNSGTIDLSGHSGNIAHWETSTDGGNTWIIQASSASTLSYTNISTTTQYRVLIQSGVCADVLSPVVIITVTPNSVGGLIIGGATVCANINSGSLVLSGNLGNVLFWEKSINGGTSWTQIPNTTTIHNYNGLTVTTMFRAAVQAGSCDTVKCIPTIMTITPAPVAGTTSGVATVCAGSNSGQVVLSGQSGGSISHWEQSTDGGVSWTIVSNTTTTLNYSNLNTTTTYRAAVGNNQCQPVYSSATTISVDPQTVAGTVIGDAEVCASTANGTVQLFGEVGSVLKWQESTDGGATYTDLAPNTTRVQAYSVSQTTLLRAVVQSGVCAVLDAQPATIKVNPPTVAGTITGIDSVCYGNNSGSLTLNGNNGNVLRWEQSTDGGLTFSALSNTSNTYSFIDLPSTTYFRVVLQTGSCPLAYSNIVAVVVSTSSANVSIAGGTQVCSGLNSGALQVFGNSGGAVVNWESSTDNGVTWNTIANTSTTLNYTNLTKSTLYHAIIRSGKCPLVTSAAALIEVGNLPQISLTVSGDKARRPIVFNANAIVSNGIPASYVWDFGDSTGISTGANVTHAFKYEGIHKVKLIVSSEKACTDSVTETLNILEPDEFIIANMVTINQNGENDTWYVENIEKHPDSEVFMYNRYGKLVYNAAPYRNDWAGTYEGGQLPDGTYYYVLRFRESGKTYKGNVTIVR